MKKVLTVTMDGIRYHASRPADCRLKHPQPGDLLRFTIKNIKIFLPLCEKGCSVLPHDISI